MATPWDEEPGKLSLASVQEMLGGRVADRVVAALPANFQGAIDVAKVGKGVMQAIAASVGSGPLAVVGAVYAGVQAIDSALSAYASLIREQIDATWVSALDQLSTSLIQGAKGRILSVYQPADTLTLARAQAFTSNKKGKIGKVETLVAQFRPGYVIGVKRPARSDYIAATVPILIYRGHPLGASVRESIYGDNPKGWIGPVGDDWGEANRWAPLGLVPWDGSPLRLWIETAVELKNAKGCPPIRQKIMVAPGLAPAWGPYGEEQALSSTMMAYAGALLSNPPSDLDFVAERIAAAWNFWKSPDPRDTGILELLWAREDLARRGDPKAGKPRGDDWAGPLTEYVYGVNYDTDTSDGEDAVHGQEAGTGGKPGKGGGFGGGFGGLDVDAGDSANAGSGGGGVLLGLGALALGGGAIVAGRHLFFKGRRRGRRG